VWPPHGGTQEVRIVDGGKMEWHGHKTDEKGQLVLAAGLFDNPLCFSERFSRICIHSALDYVAPDVFNSGEVA
jgi:hypothetical protein